MVFPSVGGLRVTSLIQAADLARRRAAIWGVSAAALLWLLDFIVVVWMKAQPVTTSMNVAQLAVQSVGAGSPIFGFLIYLRMVRPGRLLMWLRRFRSDYHTRLRFHSCLWRASRALVTPATLQDQSFRSSLMTGFVRAWLFWPLALVGWIVGLFPLSLLVFQAGVASGLALLAVIIVWTTAYGFLAFYLVRRLGWRTFKDLDALELSVRRLRGGSGVPFGIDVVRVADAIWRKAVSSALQRSDLVVVDVTDPTQNLLWELEDAIRTLGPHRVVLAREGGNTSEGVEVVDDPATALDMAVSWPSGTHDCFCLFVYPARQAGLGLQRARQYRDVSDRLRRVIADCLLAPA